MCSEGRSWHRAAVQTDGGLHQLSGGEPPLSCSAAWYLDRMARMGAITAEEAEAAKREPLDILKGLPASPRRPNMDGFPHYLGCSKAG